MKASKSSKEMEPASELLQPRWAVVSFDKCAASNLTYDQAVRKISELEAAKIPGLCIIAAEAAERMRGGKSRTPKRPSRSSR